MLPNGIYCGEFTFCSRCEKCIARRFITGIEHWFSPMPYQQKLVFFIGLLRRCSQNLIGCFLSTVKMSDGKERVYSFAKTNPHVEELNELPLRNTFADFSSGMMDIFLEFLTFSDYQKKVVMFHFFKLCDDRFLADLSSQMYNMIGKEEVQDNISSSESSDEGESDSEKQLTKAKSEESLTGRLETLHDTEPMSNYESEEDGFCITDEEEKETTATKIPARSTLSSASGKRKKRRMPLFVEKSGKDFLSALPVGIAKKILGYLDRVSIANCLCVSTSWRHMTEEVVAEFRVQSDVLESVKLMQVTAMGTTGQQCNPRYARFSDVLVPNVDLETGKVIPAAADQRSNKPEEGPSDFIYGSAFDGVQTRKVIMEERNMFCGPFNVMVVVEQPDRYRVLHNDGGALIASGSRNRIIELHDLTTGQTLENVLEGHSGSVRCVRISTADSLVFSGSYDTGVRVWDLKTGKFTKTFNGHQATVLCLAYENQLIVSGSVDRTCRVWSVKSLKCIRKFYHHSAVTAVAIRTAYMEERVVSGDIKGHVKVWNLRSGHLIKVLHGHSAEVTAIDLDRWFILSASKDNYVMCWSNQGDHKRCLIAFAHPHHALSVSLRYLRAVTGCADGRIRIWSLLNGNCIKVLRGNSRNDPILSLDCKDNMMTVNTESNVIVMKFEPIKFNYTTSEIYLPNSALTLASRNAVIASSDIEFDSNGEPLGAHKVASRPHSAVRAARMHILQCASREISGSRASEIMQSRRAVSSESAYRIQSASTTTSGSRPNTSPSGQRRRRHHRPPSGRQHGRQSPGRPGSQLDDATFIQDPETVTSMLDHRCYPLRHCDLEYAKRIQSAALLPPWRKEEADIILQPVRDEHQRLVDKRRSIRQQKAEQQRLRAAMESASRRQAATSGEESELECSAGDDNFFSDDEDKDDKDKIRRMTWAFHRAHLKSASTYSGNTTTVADELAPPPVLAPAPQPPPLRAAQKDLRRALLPGANPPALPFIRVAVSEVMRQDREELTTSPPLRVIPPAAVHRQRQGSVNLDEKPLLTSSRREKQHKKHADNDGNEPKRLSSAQVMRKMILRHVRETEEKRRGSLTHYLLQANELTPEEQAAIEKKRLNGLAKELESGGWETMVKETQNKSVSLVVKPSPVAQTVYGDKVMTTIPKPIEVVTAITAHTTGIVNKPNNMNKPPRQQSRPGSTASRSQSAAIGHNKRLGSATGTSGVDPLMRT